VKPEEVKGWLYVAGAVVVAYAAYRAYRGASDLLSLPAELAGELADWVAVTAKEGGAEFQRGYERDPVTGDYNSPMVNDQGMDFRYF
jgi:hypothetical protein